MARGIVRYSLNGDAGSRYTNQVRGALEARDFERRGRTGSLEAREQTLSEVIAGVKEALDVVDGLAPPVALDHVWVYIDQAA